MPVDRNTNACSATATVQATERLEIRAASSPPPNGPPPVARLAVTALITASTDPNLARARASASPSDSGSAASADSGERTRSIDASERVVAARDTGAFHPSSRK